MKDDQIQEQLEELASYEMKRQVVEGYHSADLFFTIVDLRYDAPTFDRLNRLKKMLTIINTPKE